MIIKKTKMGVWEMPDSRTTQMGVDHYRDALVLYDPVFQIISILQSLLHKVKD